MYYSLEVTCTTLEFHDSKTNRSDVISQKKHICSARRNKTNYEVVPNDPSHFCTISPQPNSGPPFAPLSSPSIQPSLTSRSISTYSLTHPHTHRDLSAFGPAQSDSHWVNMQGAKGWLSWQGGENFCIIIIIIT